MKLALCAFVALLGTHALVLAQSPFTGMWQADASPLWSVALRAQGQTVTGRSVTCDSLRALKLSNGAVTLANEEISGSFVPPGTANPLTTLPPFCRVAVTLKPSIRSDIRSEVWLPINKWNGRLLVTGNGSFAGAINYGSMSGWIREGYAVASTDTGHRGAASNTFVNDDVLTDYSHRANHETTVAAKRVINGFYGAAPKFSYYHGCSTGGRTGLVAARLHPDDFDGIHASAPNTQTSTQVFSQISTYQALSSAPLSQQQLQVLHTEVLTACDTLDGVKDGVLENPMACTFDPGVLTCGGTTDSTRCLTPSQVDAVRKVYAGPVNARTGKRIYPGLERGSEMQWTVGPISFAVDFFKYLVFNNPAWEPKTLNFDSHPALATSRRARLLDVSPDLTRFTRRGGKLILTHGWSDASVPPRNFISYYEQLTTQTQGAAQSVRLFMVPGGGHCGGGDGTSFFNAVTALDAWVTAGKAPDRIDASRFTADFNGFDRTRPICPWPQTAHYRGSGSTDEAANFECRQ